MKKLLITPDTHFNKHDVRAYELHMQFAEDFKPDIWIHLGDCGNFDGVSRFNKDKFKEQMENPIVNDLAFCYEHNKQRRHICPNGQLIQLHGNHEEWVVKWLDKFPAMQDFLKLERDMGVKDFKVKYIPTGSQPYKVGKLSFIHGWYTNLNHPKKHSQYIHGNLVYGHTHDMLEFHSTNIIPKHRRVVGSFGTLMDEKKAFYLKHRPTNWILGFGVAYIDDDGSFGLYKIKMTTHKFIWNGRVYK